MANNRNVVYINTTPHTINFKYGDGEEFEILPSGVLLNATSVEEEVGVVNGVSFVRTVFEPSQEGIDSIQKIRDILPEAVIVGSIIAAQAYPGEVVAMTPAAGYERVHPSEKGTNLPATTKLKNYMARVVEEGCMVGH